MMQVKRSASTSPEALEEATRNESPEAVQVPEGVAQAQAQVQVPEGGSPEPEKTAEKPQVKQDWEEMFQRLCKYQEENGHTNVPLQWDEDPELGGWVAQQRQLYKDSSGSGKDATLTSERIEKLSQLGFDWSQRNPRHLQWETRFAQLQAFKKKYGHVQVPIQWDENVQLANWVSKQRQEYKNLLRGRTTRLDENRIRLLNSLGFAWQLQRGGRRRQLKAKQKTEGAGTEEKDETKSGDGQAGAILPGEVLIGQGAPPPMSPTGQFPRKKGRKKAKNDESPLAHGAPGANAVSLLQQQQQMAAMMGIPGQQGGPPNQELLDMIFARNALLHNLQRQPNGAQQGAPQGYQGGYGGPMQAQPSNPNSHLLDSIRMQSGQMPMNNNYMMQQGFNPQAQAGMMYGQQQFPGGPNPMYMQQMQMQMPGSTAPSWLMSAQAQNRATRMSGEESKQSSASEQDPPMWAGRGNRSDPPEVRLDGTEHSGGEGETEP